MSATTPDLLNTLRDIQRYAYQAQKSIQAGTATTGVTALRKIELDARDAIRHGMVSNQK